MKKEEIFELMKGNPVFYLATMEENQPRCRGMLLYKANDDGIVFHTGNTKDVYKQIKENSKVEMCFNDFKKNLQVRISGQLEEVKDNEFKDEICEDPSRKFIKNWREAGPLEDFYSSFKVFRLKNGEAVYWTMERNFSPKNIIRL